MPQKAVNENSLFHVLSIAKYIDIIQSIDVIISIFKDMTKLTYLRGSLCQWVAFI